MAKMLLAGMLAILISGCGGSAGQDRSADAGLSPAAKLGAKIFMDPGLSASGQQSCASCHDPAHAHAQTNGLAVQMGGAHLDRQGFRAVPSLRYLRLTPAFSFDKEGTPSGGLTRDGRAASFAEQAGVPLLAAHEMANGSKEDVVEKLKRASYATEFRQVYGDDIFTHPDSAFGRILFSLQQYQMEDPSFHPFDSKYDFFLAGKVALTPAELRGLALFNNPQKGNCAACHTSAPGANGAPPLFTDFTFDNLGVPRNPEIGATADPAYFDMGLCGPDRKDLANRTDLCGAFKVPTLRNVATRKVFFHNGRFKSLRDALRFYVRRDTDPELWYPAGADGKVRKFDDLPVQFKGNVNTTEGPYNRWPGMAPALSDDEIEDVIQFLGTLNDGYKP